MKLPTLWQERSNEKLAESISETGCAREQIIVEEHMHESSLTRSMCVGNTFAGEYITDD